MRRTLLAAALVAAGMTFVPAVAAAQTTPPTTLDVETSTVERTVTTVDVENVSTGDDDDSDKTGLWGLLGLLGLAGLAGLKRRRDNDVDRPPTITNPAPPKASGATSRTDPPT